MKSRIGCFDGRNITETGQILPLVYNLRFNHLVVRPEAFKDLHTPARMKIFIDVNGVSNFTDLSKEVVIFSNDISQLQKATSDGYETALYCFIEDQKSMTSAYEDGALFDYLIVELASETNIPLELLIAKLQNQKTILIKAVKSAQEAEIAFGAIETGCDGAMLQSDNIQEIVEFDHLLAKKELGNLELQAARVIDVQHIGMGYRSCIDTTSLMTQKEGLIVGSTATGGLLVSSETHYLPYMELRPFRVNAGAIHSYVWTPGEMTAYMTELKCGRKVLCVDTEGNTREVSVGRVKTEIRPLLKIEVSVDDYHINTIVQDDWHVRIFDSTGLPRNASLIRKKDELLIYRTSGGRHVGIRINEILCEK
ncbi:MAG: 3-dehydroquinate synthase II [Desulfobacteraceae bacterium]|jgi:3-dehydroquinate synthase II/3-amino-4-hydroxybenzoic acid synthase